MRFRSRNSFDRQFATDGCLFRIVPVLMILGFLFMGFLIAPGIIEMFKRSLAYFMGGF